MLPLKAENGDTAGPPIQSRVLPMALRSRAVSCWTPKSTTCAPTPSAEPVGRQVPAALKVCQPVPPMSVVRPGPPLKAPGRGVVGVREVSRA
ncbi:hypothetical protein D9M69_614240 [compost metagenome]